MPSPLPVGEGDGDFAALNGDGVGDIDLGVVGFELLNFRGRIACQVTVEIFVSPEAARNGCNAHSGSEEQSTCLDFQRKNLLKR